jgi:hypothetical protein
MPPAAIIGGAAALGLAGGAVKKNDATGRELFGMSGMQNRITEEQFGDYGEFRDLARNIDGIRTKQYDQSSFDLAELLRKYAETGNLPTQDDINRSNTLAQQLFAPQQTALNQMFDDARVDSNRTAAQLGRGIDDPILQAKLQTEKVRQQAMLNSNQGAFAAQYAQQAPADRLGFAQQRTQILGNLAQQAMANRQALLSMGQGILGNERQYQLALSPQKATQQSPLYNGITGALQGASAGMSMAGSIQGMRQSSAFTDYLNSMARQNQGGAGGNMAGWSQAFLAGQRGAGN